MEKNLLTNHCRSLHAATPIRFTKSAAKDQCSITHAAVARSNLDAAITMRSAETELQKHNRTTRNWVGNCSSKTGSRRQSEKKDDFEALFKRIFRRKITSAKMEKSADKSLSQPSCSHSNTIYEVQLQKTIVLRMQPRHQATLTQPSQCDLQRLSCKTPIELRATGSEIAASKPDLDAKAKKRRF